MKCVVSDLLAVNSVGTSQVALTAQGFTKEKGRNVELKLKRYSLYESLTEKPCRKTGSEDRRHINRGGEAKGRRIRRGSQGEKRRM